jgi:transglutaminase-like putative cysteine protease
MCYDFSSLFASMLRSINVPTKLVKGYGDKVKGYHAWNEVYLDGKWLTVDTSFDAQMAQNKQNISMYKDSSAYDKVSEF